MPFDLPKDAKLAPIRTPTGPSAVSLGEQLAAAFSLENTVGAVIGALQEPRFEPDPEFDSVSRLTDVEILSAPHLAKATSAEHLDWLRQKLDREREARRQVDAGPLPGILVELTAGLLDPINLAPLGWARTPAKLAVGVAGSVAASETILQATQLERPIAESVAAVALGGALGYGLGWIAKALGANAAAKYTAAVKSAADAVEHTLVEIGTLSAARAGFTSPITPKATTPLAKNLGPLITKLADWGLMSPGAALAFSEDPLVRRLVHKLVDTGVYTEGMAYGVTMGHSLDTRIRTRKAQFQMALQDIVETGYAEFRRGRAGSRDEFFAEVATAMREGDVHPVEAVEKTAKALRSEILAKLGKEAKSEGLIADLLFGGEGVDPGRAGYVPQRVLADKVNANPSDFKRRVFVALMEKVSEINDRIYAAEQLDLDAKAIAEHLADVKAKLKAATDKNEIARLRAGVAELKASLAAKRKLAKEAKKSVEGLKEISSMEVKAAVEEFVTRLNKTDYTRFQEFRVKFGNLKERGFTLPPDIMRDYGDNDIFNILSAYINGVVTDIETQKMFGWLEPPEGGLDNPFEEILNSAQKRAERDPKSAKKILLRAAKDVDMLQELLRRVRGTNAGRLPPSMVGLSRAAEQARNWNFMRLMGSSVLSNIPDFARVAAANGFAKTLGFVIKDMMSFFRTTRLAKKDARKLGIAIDTVLNHRMRVIESLDETYRGRTKLEAFLTKRMTPTLAKMMLIPQWSDAMKTLDSILSVDMLLGIADDIAAGKLVSPSRMRELTRVGLDEDWARKIAAATNARSTVDGLRQLDYEALRAIDPNLAEQTLYAVHQHLNDTVITPGVGDIPAWMDRNDLGRTVSQFKRWVVAAQTRVVLRVAQHVAAREYGTAAAHIAGLLTAGMVSTALRDISADGSIDKQRSVNGWVWSGLDRAGLLGLYAEVDAMVGMTTGWNAARVVAGAQLSKYRERTALDQALGPTAGLIDDTLKAVGRLTDGKLDLKDAQAMRRLAPLQNWFVTNYLLDIITGKQELDDKRAQENAQRLLRSAMP